MFQRIGTRLFVSRLSFFTTKEQLKTLFSPFGEVTEASLVMDPRTGRTKGYGFISYQSDIEAQKAIKAMNGRMDGVSRHSIPVKIVAGRLIFVEPAKVK